MTVRLLRAPQRHNHPRKPGKYTAKSAVIQTILLGLVFFFSPRNFNCKSGCHTNSKSWNTFFHVKISVLVKIKLKKVKTDRS